MVASSLTGGWCVAFFKSSAARIFCVFLFACSCYTLLILRELLLELSMVRMWVSMKGVPPSCSFQFRAMQAAIVVHSSVNVIVSVE